MANVPMTLTDCWCGLPFSMPERLYEQCKRNGTTFFCPLGHRIVFRETEADKYRRERDRLKQQLARKDDTISSLYEQRDKAERRLSATKGQVTRLKNRASAGVCPCCNRSFQNLKRHMNTKHPDYAKPDLKVVS